MLVLWKQNSCAFVTAIRGSLKGPRVERGKCRNGQFVLEKHTEQDGASLGLLSTGIQVFFSDSTIFVACFCFVLFFVFFSYLLLVLLPEPFHVLPGLLQQVPLPPQLPILPSQHVHVILQLSLVTQEPAVEGAKTPQKHLALTISATPP